MNLTYSVRVWDALKAQMSAVEAAHPTLRGTTEKIRQFYDQRISGKPGQRVVYRYSTRGRAGPNEPMPVQSVINVFVEFGDAHALIVGLWFRDADVAVGAARDIKLSREQSHAGSATEA